MKSMGVDVLPTKDDWEARDALQVLIRAEEIEKNTKLMVRVRKEAKRRLAESQEAMKMLNEEAKEKNDES